MKPRNRVDIPEDAQKTFQRAWRVQWVSFFLMLSGVILVTFTLGQSQAMKAVWVEDALALLPPLAYLITARIRFREPNEKYPYGYNESVTLGFVASALVLLCLGVLVLLDSLRTLITKEHPTIGVISLAGHQIWLGWLMIPVLAYTIACEYTMGRIKQPLARKLHDTTLAADARMNRADWMTGATGIIGILGIAHGFWWADSLAATLISVEIVRDGVENLREAVDDVMNEAPDEAHEDEAADWGKKLCGELAKLPWVREVDIRLREEGNLFTGEVFVVPATTEDITKRYSEIQEVARGVDWRFYDLSFVPVEKL